MTRVKQFADDLGISRNKAQALINKGRSRKDGGSQILESVMADKTKEKEKKKKKKEKKNRTAEYRIEMDGDGTSILELAPRMPYNSRDDNDDSMPYTKGGRTMFAGGSVAPSVKKDVKKINKKPKDPMGERFGKDGEYKMRPKTQAPYDPKFNPDQYHEKLNPKGTKGRPKVSSKNKKADGGFPDLTGDGKVTKKDILKGRGVPGFSRGGGMAIQGLGFKGVK